VNKSIVLLLLFDEFPEFDKRKDEIKSLFTRKKSENKSNNETPQNNKRRRNFGESKKIKSADDDDNIYNTNRVQSGNGNIFYKIKKRCPHNADNNGINSFERSINNHIFF
jgi:hypothetical protein